MTTLALQKEIVELKAKVSLLEKAMMAPFDEEGEYKSAFMRSMLRRASEKPKTLFEYKKRGNLLKQLRSR